MSSRPRRWFRLATAALASVAVGLAGGGARAQIAVRVTPDVGVSKIVPYRGDVWFETPRGVFRSARGEEQASPVPVAGAEGFVALKPVGKDLWLASTKKVYRVEPASGEPILALEAPDGDGSITLRDCSGTAWAGHGTHVYRLGAERPVLIRDFPLDSFGMALRFDCPTRFQGHSWVEASRIDEGGDVARRVSVKGLDDPARRAFERASRYRHFFAPSGDVWIFPDFQPPVRVRGESLDAEPVQVQVGKQHTHGDWMAGGEVGFWGEDGLYRILDDDRVERVLPADPHLSRQVLEVLGAAWFLVDHGAYRLEGSRARRHPAADGASVAVDEIVAAGGQTWLTTSHGAYRVEPAGKYPDEDVAISAVVTATGDDGVWLVGKRAIYRLKGPSAVKAWDDVNGTAPAPPGAADAWKTVAGSFLVHSPIPSPRAAWISRPTEATREGPLARAPLPLLDVLVRYPGAGNVYWANADQAAGQSPPVGAEQGARVVSAVKEIDGRVWLATDRGAFRMDEDLHVSVRLKGPLVRGVWTAGAAFADVSYDPPGRPLGFDGKEASFQLRRADDDRPFTPVHSYAFDLRAGRFQQTVVVRDAWDNLYRTRVDVRVLPLLGALGSLWAALVGLTLALAPVSRIFNDLLMSRAFRTVGSLGTIPLLLGLSATLRRHVLRRYRRALAADVDFASLRDRYVVPSAEFAPEAFAARLARQRRLLLIGQSGLGKTSYFRYLTALFAAGESGRPLDGAIPVFIPLGRYPGEDPEAMFHAQLRSYGQLTDRALTAWLLRRGGFVIFVDGLNEVDEEARRRINRFVDQHWGVDFICLSSQEAYPLFSWREAVELAALAPDTVAEILERRLGKERADAARKEFTGDTYEMCRIPQDFEYVIELLERGEAPPRSPHALYERILDPVLAGWEARGFGDDREVLFRRAYEMLRDKAPWIERGDDPVPSTVRADLVREKLLVRVEGPPVRYHFRHDRIRAHLASRWFAPRWSALLGSEDAGAIDTNWRGMMEFVVLAIGDAGGVRDLVLALLRKNHAVAREVFNWADRSHHDLTATWAEDFKRSYGEALLRQAATADNAVGRSALLNGQQYEQLQAALIAAFPDVGSLKQMLRFELDTSLDAIAIGPDLRDIAFKVIGRAEAEGWTAKLIAAARAANPGNPLLLASARQLGLPAPTDKPDR